MSFINLNDKFNQLIESKFIFVINVIFYIQKKDYMTKKGNHYKLTLEQTALLDQEAQLQTPIVLEFMNHDEIFKIIEIMKDKNPFDDVNQSTEFAIGLKIFLEVVMKNKNNPLFEELLPAMKSFMPKLKASLKE